MRTLRAPAAIVALAWSCAGSCDPADAPPRPLASADQVQARAVALAAVARHASASERKAARGLLVDGDAAYREGRYDDAHRLFENVTPNAPDAYALLMTADSHWRASVAYGLTRPASSPANCRLRRQYFVDDLRLDLDQGYLLGLHLARIEPGHPLAGSAFLARARGSANCLARLADELEPEPAQTCVDETRIAACLGAPLRR